MAEAADDEEAADGADAEAGDPDAKTIPFDVCALPATSAGVS